MTSAPVLDLDQLAKPVSDAHPAGVPLAAVVWQQLQALRVQDDPDDPTAAGRKADWPKILQITTDALTGTGKDLDTAVRLVEAATKLHGAAGLRDGLRLLHRLVTECWDRLLPVPEPGDTTDVREARVAWLNDIGTAAKFPETVLHIPLVELQGVKFGAAAARDKVRKKDFDAAVNGATPAKLEDLRTTYHDLLAAKKALAELAAALAAKRVEGSSARDYTSPETPGNLGTAIDQAILAVEDVAKRRSFPLVPPPPPATPANPGTPPPGTAAPPPPPGPADDRDGLYRQVEQIAAALRRIEPHSPIPYLLERCVKLGSLPFPQLMRAMVREKATLDDLDRLLGLEEPPKRS